MTNRQSDALVVGGGIVGLACALELSRDGHSVRVIDRAEIGRACSHGNCGWICPSHVLPLNEPGAIREGLGSLFRPSAPLRIQPQLRLDLYRWLLQFARRCTHEQMLELGRRLLPLLEFSMSEYESWFEQMPNIGAWQRNGLAYVFRTPARFEQFAETDELVARAYGITSRRIEASELEAFDPALRPDLAGAYFHDHDGSVRPDRLVHDLRRQYALSCGHR